MEQKLHRITLAESAITLSEDGKVPSTVQLMRTGKFYDPFYGEMAIERFHLEAMVKNFELGVRGVDCAIDYAHNSHLEAAGWIKKVYVDGDGLFLNVDWTPKGEQCLANKEYRYLSADFYFDYVDNESGVHYGPTLNGGGLTNRPFIKKMAPVVELSETKGEYVNELEQAKKTITEQTESIKKLTDQVTELTTQTTKLSEENASLKKAGEEATKLAEKNTAFAKLLSEGKACEAQRDAFITGDTVKFAELHQPVNLSAQGHGGSGEGDGGGNAVKTETPAQDEVLKLAQAKVTDKSASDIKDAISKVLSEKPELAKKYKEETKPVAE